MAADWRTRTLHEIHQGGIVSIDPRQSSEETFEYYSIPAYQSGCTPVRAKGESILSQKLMIPQRCVLFGKLNPRVEKVWNVKSESNSRRLASTEWLPIVPPEDVDQDFLYFLLRSEHVMPIAQSLVSGSTPSRERVEPRAFYDIQVPVPGIDEQTAIAAVLSKVQRAIDIEEKLIATTRELKQTAMQHLFTRGPGGEESKETEIGLIPQSWQLVPLAEVREFLQYGTSEKCHYASAGRPVLRIPNVIDGRVDSTDMKWTDLPADEAAALELHEGDVVFVRTNGVRDRVGSCAVYHGEPTNSLFASYLIRARLRKELLDPDFLAYFVMTEAGRAQLAGRASPAADGKFNINTKLIDAVRVPLPESADIQKAIVGMLQAIDRKTEVHSRRYRVLADLFARALTDLMSAKLRIPEPTGPLESATSGG
jgi:type I restriction enzyme S subunit